MTFWRSLTRFYKLFALMVLNTVLLFLLFNAILLVAFRIKDAHVSRRLNDPVAVLDRTPELKQVYPDMDADAIHRLLVETWKRSFVYEPFTQFKERPFRGEFVNVSRFGFRHSSDQGPWPPTDEYFTVFVFGGSTAFGYGVADDRTFASYMQQSLAGRTGLDVRTYNFGRGSYTSSQELALFERLLATGTVPNMAIFVDGLNEFAFHGGPPHSQRLEAAFHAKGAETSLVELVGRLPMARLAAYTHRKAASLIGRPPGPAGAHATRREIYDDPTVIDKVIRRYTENKRIIEAIAREYGVRVAFVWQPIPLYKYDLRYHLFGNTEFGTNHYAPFGYEKMAASDLAAQLGPDFLWCADMQEALHEPLYVDHVHYTARMNARIAATVSDMIVDRGLLARD